MKEWSPQEIQRLLKKGQPLLLLDVRQPEEHATARITSARLIPLGQLNTRMEEIADWKEGPVVVYCHHGMRSQRACQMLEQAGFNEVINMSGGIDAWSLLVDPEIPRY